MHPGGGGAGRGRRNPAPREPGAAERRVPPDSYLVGVGDVDGLSVLRHVADDALAPGHLHLAAVLGGAAGQQRGAGVHVEELGDQALLAGGRPLHEEQRAPVGVHHEADEDEDLVAEAGEVQVVGDVLDQLQEELPLVMLLEVALVVQGRGRVLGQADAGLQQGAEDVRGGGGQGAGLPQQRPPPYAAQRLLRPGVHVLIVGEVDVDGLGAGEALPQLLLGRPPLQPPGSGPARAAPAAADPPLLRRSSGGRLGKRVSPLQPPLHQLGVPVQETFHRRHVKAAVGRHGTGSGGVSGHAPTGAAVVPRPGRAAPARPPAVPARSFSCHPLFIITVRLIPGILSAARLPLLFCSSVPGCRRASGDARANPSRPALSALAAAAA